MEQVNNQEEQKCSAQDSVLTTFRLQSLKGIQANIKLIGLQGENKQICIEYQDGKNQTIEWKDLLGATVDNNRVDIVSFPKKVQKSMFRKFENRFKEIISFSLCDKSENVEQVLQDSKVVSISLEEMKNIVQAFAQKKQTDIFAKAEERTQKELLVFINPHSGKGQAQQVFDRIKELFDISGYKYHIVETLYRLHCFDYLYELDIDKLLSYTGIVCVSGDGTPHEIVNALLLRPDREKCLQIPVGGIHGGSGNAFPTTLCHQSGEYSTPECAAYLIIKGSIKKLDIMEFQRENINDKEDCKHVFKKSKSIYSFLSLSWAYISDLDLGSESLRFLGETRFEVYGFWRLVFLNKYSASLQYSNSLKAKLPEITKEIPNEDIDQFKNLNNQLFTFFYLSNLPWVSEKYKSFPLAKTDDGLFDFIYLTNEQSRFQMMKTALSLDQGTFFDLEKQTVAKGYDLKYEKIRSIRLTPVNSSQSGCFSIDGERYDAEPIQGTVLSKILNVFCF